MVIGITGTSGAGKTFVSKIIGEKLNYKIIDADEIVKKLSKREEKYFKEIVKTFGKEILTKEDEIDRKKLSNIIFENEIEREKLNKLTFKYVIEEIKKQMEKDCIIDAPLLFESKLDKLCDITIAILADYKIKIERICTRDKIEKDVAKKRIDVQQNDEYYKNKAKYIIENNNTNELETYVKKILQKLKAL